MPEPLIGFLYLTQATHPQWEHQYPEDNLESVPQTAWLPQLAVAGLPFVSFAWAMLRKARAVDPAQLRNPSPYPEDAYFDVQPEDVEEAEGTKLVQTATCACGYGGCGSNSAWVTREERNGVVGLSFTNWYTRDDPQRALPFPPLFVAVAAWPPRGETGRLRALLGNRATEVEMAKALWEENRPRMVGAARQAAVGLNDPWGRSLDLDKWSAEHLQERKHLRLMQIEKQRHRCSPASVLAHYEQELQACDRDEALARQDLGAASSAAGSLASEPDPRRVSELLQRINDRRTQAYRVFQEELLPPRERRIARRARARARKESYLAVLNALYSS